MAGRSAGPESTFVGRAAELEALAGLLDRVRDGGGTFATVSGGAGIGKSRLLTAFLERARPRASVLVASCSIGAAPLAVWRELLSGPLVDPVEVDGPLGRDPVAVAQAILGTLGGLSAPIVIALDDLHLADEASRSVLGRLIAEVGRVPVLVVGTVRAPRVGPAGESAVPLPLAGTDLTIAGLSAPQVAELVRARLPELSAGELERAVESLVAMTGGNPLQVLTRLALLGADDGGPATLGVTGGGTADVDAPLRDAIGRLLPRTRNVLVTAVIAGDLPLDLLARHAGVAAGDLAAALTEAQAMGLAGPGPAGRRVLHPRIAELLLEGDDPERVRRIHLALGRALAGEPTVAPAVVAGHLLAAGDDVSDREVAPVALAAGLAALEQHAYADADRLLEVAGLRWPEADGAARARLAIALGRARARRGLGDLTASVEHAGAAARLAEALGDADAFAEASVLHAYPPDWLDDDVQARRLLARADLAPTSPRWRARVRATRARLEMRSPAERDADGRVWNWVTLPGLAQPMSDEAVRLARDSGDAETLVMALLAWRSNHRAPSYLGLRRRATDEAVRLAGRLGRPELLHEAALRAFIDRLEDADRDGAEEAARLVRLAATRAVEPRLVWRARALDVTLAWLDGDLERARAHREEMTALGLRDGVPGAAPVAALLLGQELLITGAHAVLDAGVADGHPSQLHPLGLAGRAVARAGLGDLAGARAALDALPDPLDPESSLLAVAGLAARAIATIADADRATVHLELLEPWRERAATDSEGLFVPVPVASFTARLRDVLGDAGGARRDRATAREVAEGLRAHRSMVWLEAEGTGAEPSSHALLTPRQVRVLALLAAGRSNPDIAAELHFGVATIARETSAIYRALGVANRAEAVREATRRSLLTFEAPAHG